jgi:molybdopterin/thiamine biosynthesis adenylyltransferase
MNLSDNEFIRYSRSLMLGDDALERQLRLRQARVLVLGLGGLGCPVASTLISAGVGALTLIDGDVVELSNLPRQQLYQTNDVGKPKAKVAAARLRQHNPHPQLQVLQCRLNDEALREAAEVCDVLVDCSDNLPTRLQLNRLARETGKPLFAGAVSGASAQLYLLNRHSACYQCLVDPDWQMLQNCRSMGVDPALVTLTAQQLAWLLLQYLQASADQIAQAVPFGQANQMPFGQANPVPFGHDSSIPFGHYGRFAATDYHIGFHWYPLQQNPDCACCGTAQHGAF